MMILEQYSKADFQKVDDISSFFVLTQKRGYSLFPDHEPLVISLVDAQLEYCIGIERKSVKIAGINGVLFYQNNKVIVIFE